MVNEKLRRKILGPKADEPLRQPSSKPKPLHKHWLIRIGVCIVAIICLASAINVDLRAGYSKHIEAVVNKKKAKRYLWLGNNNFYHIKENQHKSRLSIQKYNHDRNSYIQLGHNLYVWLP